MATESPGKKTIEEQTYLLHMALWKLHAIEEYNHGRIRTSAKQVSRELL